MTGNRVLITGVQGFIGSYLTAHWLQCDTTATIIGVGRSPEAFHAFTHEIRPAETPFKAPLPEALIHARRDERYSYHSLDLRDRAAVRRLIEDCSFTHIVHLAGSLRDEPAEQLFTNNVLATATLLECIAETALPPPRIVIASTGSVYGKAGGGAPPRGPAPEQPVDLYSTSKLATEQASKILAARHALPLLLARIFNVVGPGQDERHLCGWLARQIAQIRNRYQAPEIRVGPLDTTRDFLDVREVALALYLLATRGRAGATYDVGSGAETPAGRVLEHLCEIAGLDGSLTIRRLPARAADIPRLVADTAPLAELGFAPEIPLRTSLVDLLTYYEDILLARRPHHLSSRRLPGAADAELPGVSLLEVRNQREDRYTIHVGPDILQTLPQLLARAYPGVRMAVLTDDRVFALLGEAFVRDLCSVDIATVPIVVEQGEQSKSLHVLSSIAEQLFRGKLDRRGLLLNLGGGMITDLGGFVAATYMRGIRYANVPTTLLAQHDAAVGGKVAVNTPWAKNFLGAFHDPAAVYCDTAALRSLDARAISSGIAEAIKVAIIREPDLFGLLEREERAIRELRDAAVLGEVVLRATKAKIELLAPDPFEADLRRALNLGHSFAHTLETTLGYRRILHGEAVGFGIAVAAEIACSRGVCDRTTADRIHQLLAAYDLPPRVEMEDLLSAIDYMAAIRLIRGNHLHFVLPEGIGAVRIVPDLSRDELRQALEAIAEHPTLGNCIAA